MSLESYQLSNLLKENLKDKILFYNSCYDKNVLGKYSSYEEQNILFQFSYQKKQYLNLLVGANKNSFGEKLAVLSEFYGIFAKEFGGSSVFYVTKNGFLNFYWDLTLNKSKMKEIEDNCYSNDNIIEFIFMGRTMFSFFDKEFKDNFFEQYHLPIDLVNVLNQNFEEFLKYREMARILVRK